MLNLIKNEYIKLLKRKIAIFALLFVFGIPLLGSVISHISFKNNEDMIDDIKLSKASIETTLKQYEGKELKYTFEGSEIAITNIKDYMDRNGITTDDSEKVGIILNIISLQDRMEKGDLGGMGTYEGMLNAIKSQKYIIENDIDYAVYSSKMQMESGYWLDNSSTDFLSYFNESSTLVMLVLIVTIGIAGIIVASEYADGTIKFLLINPVKRRKIILSKYITVLSAGLILTTLLYVFTLVFSLIINGSEGTGAIYFYVSDGELSTVPFLIANIKEYALEYVDVVIYGTMAFAISGFAKSSAAAITLAVAASLSGSMISNMLALFGQDWGRYLLFSNTNLTNVSMGNTLFPAQSLNFAITVIVVHVVVFFLIGYDAFTRKEV